MVAADVSTGLASRAFFVLSAFAAVVAAFCVLVAWVVPDFYWRDPAAARLQMIGQDLVTLVVAVPAIFAPLALLRRRPLEARILLLGGVLYLSYTYMTYAFTTRFNTLFLAYVGTLGAASFAFAFGLAAFPLHELGLRISSRFPWRALGMFLIAIGIVFSLLWLSDIGQAYVHGAVPQGAIEVGMPTSPIHVQDLAFILPLSVLAGVLLVKRRVMGALLGGIMLVKAITIALAMLAMTGMMIRAGEPANVPVTVAAGFTLVVALILGRAYLRGIGGRATAVP